MNQINITIPEPFDRTELLSFLYDEAKKRMISPWAALGNALTEAALAIPPGCLIPTRVGKQTVPNVMFAYVAPPGGGKGISSSRILKFGDELDAGPSGQSYEDALRPITPASGQAFAAGYVEWVPPRRANKRTGQPATPGYLKQHSDARHFMWTEVDQLSAQMSNSADSVSAALRVAFSGAGLGTFTKGKENQLHIDEYKYRSVASIHAQPKRCGSVMDTGGGLAQRWVFLNANDTERVIRDEDWVTRQVELPDFTDSELQPKPFTVAPPILVQMQVDFRDQAHGNEWDQHRNLRRLKVAACVAVMHGSMDVTEDRWALAGVVLDHSDAVRDDVLRQMEQAREEEEFSAGARRAISEAGKRKTSSDLLEAAVKRIPRIVRDAGGGVTRSKVKRRLSAPQQGHFEDALAICSERGEVLVQDNLISLP